MPDRPPDLDPSVQASLRELMLDDYPMLLETFLSDTELRLSLLRHYLLTDSWELFRQAAHSLRGSCGNMGAPALHQAAERAEQAGAVADGPAASTALERLEELFQRVKPRLQPIISR